MGLRGTLSSEDSEVWVVGECGGDKRFDWVYSGVKSVKSTSMMHA